MMLFQIYYIEDCNNYIITTVYVNNNNYNNVVAVLTFRNAQSPGVDRLINIHALVTKSKTTVCNRRKTARDALR